MDSVDQGANVIPLTSATLTGDKVNLVINAVHATDEGHLTIRDALTAGGNTHFVTEQLPGLNHLFQTASTGAPNEYASIEETMSPIVLEKISIWVLER